MLFGRFIHDENGRLFLNSYFTDITEKQTEEENQKALLDNLPFGAAMYEFDGSNLNLIHLNSKYWQLVGRSPIEYSNASFLDMVHPDDKSIISQEIFSAIKQNRGFSADLRIKNDEDRYIPFHITASIVTSKDGKFHFYACYDKISEEEMSLQEMLPIALSTIVSNTEDISYVVDKNLRYICVSQSVANMVGTDNPRDLIGKTASDIFPETFSEKFKADDRRVIETGKSSLQALEHIPTPNGGVCLARTSKFPILNSQGKAVGIYCVSRDITAQKEKESQLELLTDSIAGGLAAYSISDDGIKTLYFNDGYYNYSGYTREEYLKMIEQEPLALMFPEDRHILLDMVRDFSKNKKDGMKGECTYRCRTKDGEVCYMSMKAVLTQVGEKYFVLNVVQIDVTTQALARRKQMELLDNLPFGAGMFEFDGETFTAYHINKRYEKIVGRKNNSSNSTNKPFDFIHCDDRKIVRDEICDAIAHNRDAYCNIRIICGDGEYKLFHLDVNIKASKNGKYILFVAYSRISDEEQNYEKMLPHMFDTIMESSTDLAFAKDINFRYIRCSKTFADILGLESEKNVIGKTDYELFPKEVADMFRQDDSALFADGKPQIDVDEAIPSHNGTLHYTRTSKHLLRDVTGNAIGIYGIGRDITEVREAFARLKLLTNTIPGGIATFRCMPGDLEMIYSSDGIISLIGYSREDFQKRKISPLKIIFSEDRPIIHQQMELLMNGETALDFTFRIHTKDGNFKWINASACTTDRRGNVFTVSVVLTDVTKEQEENELLRRTKEEYRIAASHSNSTICRYLVKGKELVITQEASVRLNVPEVMKEIPYGKDNLNEISEESKQKYLEFYENIMNGSKENTVCFKKRLNGCWHWLEAHATTVYDDSGKPVTAIISYNDITELREKEAIYSHWQNVLSDRPEDSYTLFRANLSKGISFDSRSGSLLNKGFDNLKLRFDDLVAEYVKKYVYADDRARYRAFLNSNTMLAEYMRGHHSDSIEYRELLPDGKNRWLKLSVDLVKYPNSDDIEAQLMYENIDKKKRTELEILERAETDSLTGLLNRSAFAVRVNQIIGTSSHDAQHALLMMDVDGFKQVNDIFGHGAGDETLVDIAGQLTKITRREDLVGRLGGDEFFVFLSNIPNAEIAATMARKICKITRKTFTMDVKISTSIGIAMYPQHGEGFESLYKMADEALYSVKDTGKDGYSFSHEKPVTELEISKGIETNSKPITKSKQHRMLIVDDNRVDRAILANLFKNDYEIEFAKDGGAAIATLRHFGMEISVVLLDLMMPEIDGYEVLKEVQKNDKISSIPIIVISADESRETTLNVIRAGGYDLIAKPIDPDILRARVEKVISRTENEWLRTKNCFLSIRNTQTGSFRAALEHSGIIVITLDRINNEFLYCPGIEKYLAGKYDGRSLWNIFLSDMVTDSQTVQKMQELVRVLAVDDGRKDDSCIVRLKIPSGLSRLFLFSVFKENNDNELSDRIIMTLREVNKNNG